MTESVVSGTMSGVSAIETAAGPKPTPGQQRTARARRAAARLAEQKRADWLIARGWTCTPPDDDTEERP